jgi:hypothetical protein
MYTKRDLTMCVGRATPGRLCGGRVIKPVVNEPNKVTHRFVYATLDS